MTNPITPAVLGDAQMATHCWRRSPKRRQKSGDGACLMMTTRRRLSLVAERR